MRRSPYYPDTMSPEARRVIRAIGDWRTLVWLCKLREQEGGLSPGLSRMSDEALDIANFWAEQVIGAGC